MVRLQNREMTEPETIFKVCPNCQVDRRFARVTHFLREDGKTPEIMLTLKRFRGGARKLQTTVEIPQWLFAIAGFDKLYYVKCIIVHVGSDTNWGHYYAYERGTPAEDHERAGPEIERRPGETGADIFWRRADAPEPEPEKAFQTGTKYEDIVKTTGVPFSTIQVSDNNTKRT